MRSSAGTVVEQSLRMNTNQAIYRENAITGITAGNTRGQYAVDMQIHRTAATRVASGNYSTLGGGYYNTASGYYSFAVGYLNKAYGDHSVAIGSYARTHNRSGIKYNGSFAFGDSSSTTYVQPTANNQFVARFVGGYRFYSSSAMNHGVYLIANGASWSTISDSTKKTDFLKADGKEFLSKLATMRLGSWRYKWDEPECRHYGPFAQEFFARFGKDGLGIIGDDTTLTTADVDGVVFILLQALESRTKELKEKTAELDQIKAELNATKSELSYKVQTLENEKADLRRRLEKLERTVLGATIEINDLGKK